MRKAIWGKNELGLNEDDELVKTGCQGKMSSRFLPSCFPNTVHFRNNFYLEA